MTAIIETHCHLDYLKAKDLEVILHEAREAGVEKIITIAVEPQNFDTVRQLARKYEQVYYTQGVHPHDARLMTDEAMELIGSRTKDPKMCAIGEIGLDYHYNHSPQETQKNVFKRQLQAAIDSNLPVVIHSRDADDDMIKILKEYGPKMSAKGVIHSFTSGPKLARQALDLGFHLGFNGIITFKNAHEVRDIVKLAPLNRILTETDAPFLTPVPHRGQENAPANLVHIVNKIAEIKAIEPELVYKQTYQNAFDVFSRLKD